MKLLSGRRIVLATLALTCASGLFALPARAADNAKQFIQSFGTQLVAIVNSPVPLSEKDQGSSSGSEECGY